MARLTERKLRQMIREETTGMLRRRGLRESSGEGSWVVGNEGYTLSGAPRDVANAWYSFTIAVAELERFMDHTFPDTESDGDPFSVGEAAVHQTQTFLTGR